jgi:DNA-binding Xre family transcriptional regulator
MKYMSKTEFAAKAGISLESVRKIKKAKKLDFIIVTGKEVIKLNNKYQNFVMIYKPRDTRLGAGKK